MLILIDLTKSNDIVYGGEPIQEVYLGDEKIWYKNNYTVVYDKSLPFGLVEQDGKLLTCGTGGEDFNDAEYLLKDGVLLVSDKVKFFGVNEPTRARRRTIIITGMMERKGLTKVIIPSMVS